MPWDLLLWLVCFLINIAVIALNLYQLLTLSDLEDDYINPYDSASRLNAVIVPEFVLHAVLCALFLLTWHWIILLITAPIAYYNMTLFMKQQHLIDVTEVFRVLQTEKRKRIVKLAFYLFLFIIITVRLVISVFNALVSEDEAVHNFWTS